MKAVNFEKKKYILLVGSPGLKPPSGKPKHYLNFHQVHKCFYCPVRNKR